MVSNCSKAGKYQMLHLPLRVLNEPVANNKIMSEERLKSIYKIFIRQKQCQKDYSRFTENMIMKEYAEK